MTKYEVPCEVGDDEGLVIDLTISPDLKQMVQHLAVKCGKRKYPGDSAFLLDIFNHYG